MKRNESRISEVSGVKQRAYYLHIDKHIIYRLIKSEKFLGEKFEPVINNRGTIRFPCNKKLKSNINTIYGGKLMTLSIGVNIRHSSHISQFWKYVYDTTETEEVSNINLKSKKIRIPV